MSSTHDCPGGCTGQVPRHQLSCRPCWYRLPKVLRDDVNAGYRKRATDPYAHRRALIAAYHWYDSHPLEATDE